MKRKAEVLQAINEKRKQVLDLLQAGDVDNAKKANDELDKLNKEYNELPIEVERKLKPMDKKEKFGAVKAAVNAFLHKGWAGMSDEQKNLVKPVNASDSPGQIETGATRGQALVPVETANFVATMDSGVYRLRDRVMNYTASTNTGKIPVVANPSDTLTNFDEFPSGGINKTQVTINAIEWNVSDYGDIVPVSNDLLADEVADVYDVIMNVFNKKMRNTENKLILDAIDSLGAGTAVHDWKDIVKAVNSADPVDGTDKVILTNTDGGDFLGTLIDNNHYLLVQPDGTSPKKYFRGYEVIQLPLAVLPNTEDDKIPFYCGSLYDAICFVERQNLSISYNPFSDSAFAKNATDVRITARLDCKPKFAGAIKKLLYSAE